MEVTGCPWAWPPARGCRGTHVKIGIWRNTECSPRRQAAGL